MIKYSILLITYNQKEILSKALKSLAKQVKNPKIFEIVIADDFSTDGTDEFVTSHWERGFISFLENGDLEIVNAQTGGRGEVLTGRVELLNSTIRLHFASKALMNDPRMLATARVFELEGDQLRYEMEMSTTKVTDLTQHLAITLVRVHE